MKKSLLISALLTCFASLSFAGTTKITVGATGSSSGNGSFSAGPLKNGYQVSLGATISHTTPPHDNQAQTETWTTSGSAIAIVIVWKPKTVGETPPVSANIKVTGVQSADATASIATGSPSVRISVNSQAGSGGSAYASAYVNGHAGTSHQHYPKSGGSKTATLPFTVALTLQPDGTYRGVVSVSASLNTVAGSSVDGGAATLNASASFKMSFSASLVKLNF